MALDYIVPIGHDDGQDIASALRALGAESVKQTALMAALANTTVSGALMRDWAEVQAAVADGLGPSVLPVGTQLLVDLSDTHGSPTVQYSAPWDVAHFETGALADGETLPVMYAQMHYALPFSTPFSPCQAFLSAIDGLPAGTYHVTMGLSWGGNVASGKSYQFTLASDLPAGGQLSGFERAPDAAPSTWQVKAWASPTATAATETVSVAEGTGGASLGTFDAAGVAVPLSGTPATQATVTVGGTAYRYYGLNSLQRAAYGNNRWAHSPLRQWLNSDAAGGWFEAQTVFDRTPGYVGYPGFLSMLPEAFVAAMRPVAQRTALNYVTDGGTAAAPEFDTTYDRVFLPSWKQHWLAPTQYYGSADATGEGEPWEWWERVAGTSAPLAASAWGNESTYHAEYVQRGIESGHPARIVWLRSAGRGCGSGAAVVYSQGYCYSAYAYYGFFAAPACAIG